MKKKQAFTFIECFISILIIGILSGLFISAQKSHSEKINALAYYEAYKTLLTVNKRILLTAPGNSLRQWRMGPAKQNHCDMFADLVSLSKAEFLNAAENRWDRNKNYLRGCTNLAARPMVNDGNIFANLAISDNFSTINGFTFYGLRDYPIENATETNQPNQRDYKNVYIRIPISKNDPNVNCGCIALGPGANVPTDDNLPPSEEYATNSACFQCFNSHHLYKFRVYNNGRIVPISKLEEVNEFIQYKRSYIINGEKIEDPRFYLSYSQAQAETDALSGATQWYFKTDKTYNDLLEAGFAEADLATYPYLLEDNTAGNLSPCDDEKGDYPNEQNHFNRYSCEILPIVPNVRAR